MDKDHNPLRFWLLPCPECGARLTVGDIRQTGEHAWTLLHTCPAVPLIPGGPPQYGKGFCCTGDNVRMTVQKWNKYVRERAK